LEGRSKSTPPLFSEAVELFKRALENDTGIKPQSKKYRLWCLAKPWRARPNWTSSRFSKVLSKRRV
jgi:hypothetical protein